MGTYIIHFDDKPWEDLDDELYYRCFEIPWFSTTKTTISRLTPYTEDSAYAHGYTEAESKYREIRDKLEKQAYQRGYEEAYDTAYADAEEIYESGKRAMYQKGLKDAWECARKIADMPYGEEEKAFGSGGWTFIINHTASEAIEKIRQYEQEKEEQIQVGDEVIRHYKNEFMEGDDAPSIFLSEEDGHFRCLAFNGRSIMIAEYPKNQYRKTGRHFPEIAEVLQKMKES